MGITVELVGEGSQEVEADADSYGDLLAPFDVSKHEVSIFVDGQPVPEDEPIDTTVEHVRVLRLIKGG
ncbi:ubiquitin-like small modifier protein SAMP2 [Halovenus salina]|uniref:Ubiquitin-like small modifier protein 2 n=1 Tax=Halovenus salina TaxID=1510225 RepID=A0ABD5VUU7_9EURY|nr:ubiquitin-like small modifier protein 2 [Halovenus salina]